MPPPINDSFFTDNILVWFDNYGRHDLPWQITKDPYAVWVSEIMLQQTQVNTVIPYYTRFMARFPDIQKLATAAEDDVLHLWTGLGYYARARNLHKAAKAICRDHDGKFPNDINDIIALPGIGRSTAGAISSFTLKQRQPILDGNVKRVLCRFFGVDGWPGKSNIQKKLWELAEKHTPNQRVANYTQAIMDFGATQCKRHKPDCSVCPIAENCIAFLNDKVAELPTKKPKKTLPKKTSIFLVIQNKLSETLLIKRPPSGIWGSLWCLPEFKYQNETPSKQELIDWVDHELNIKINSLTNHSSLKHTFSHYHLYADVLAADAIDSTTVTINDNNNLWFNNTRDLQIGLAAPIKKLLTD